MAEETDIYAKAGGLVKLLTSWRAAPAKKLPELIIDLAQHMADTGFWEQVSDEPLITYCRSVSKTFPSISCNKGVGGAKPENLKWCAVHSFISTIG